MADLNELNNKVNEAEKKAASPDNKTKKKKYEFDFDELRMYFGEPYDIILEDGKIIRIKQPTIGDMLELGENRIYGTITPFTTNTTAYRVQLWDMGIDWNKYSDFELFTILATSLKKEDTDLIFEGVEYYLNPNYNEELSEEENYENGQLKYLQATWDIDFQKLRPYMKPKLDESGEFILNEKEEPEQELVLYAYDEVNDDGFLLDEKTYLHIHEYLCTLFDQHPKEEFVKGKTTKEWVIDDERRKQAKLKNENKNKSFLLPLVSGLVNHPGFKYKTNELKEVGIYQFMDSVRRVQIYEQSVALLQGSYSGMIDTSKIDQENFNWLRSIKE